MTAGEPGAANGVRRAARSESSSTDTARIFPAGLARLRLADVAHGRDNNFQLLRFLAATAVILFHSYALTNHWTDEPLWKLAPELDFGSLGVKCFFVISGFLVTQSWLSRPKLWTFAAARVLRIYPALVVATLFSVLLAAGSTVVPFDTFIADSQTFDYAWRNALGWELRNDLPGAYIANPYPNAVNGSLWTLPVELRLYIGLAIAGTLGLLSRRLAWTCTVAALFVFFLFEPDLLPLSPNTRITRELALLFALGSLAYVWRAALPLSLLGLAAALSLIVVDPAGVGRGVLFDPLLAYALLTIAYHPALQWSAFNALGDYSYGLYVYSFPIQQTVVYIVSDASPMFLFAVAMPLTLMIAAISWHVVEKPLLRLKSQFH